LQIKNAAGELESPVIDRVFGMAIAISPCVTASAEGKSPSQSWHEFNWRFLLNRHSPLGG
jgi:hypothetical protein